MLEANAKAKAKILASSQSGLEALTSLILSTSHIIQCLTQSLSSFRSTCPNHVNLQLNLNYPVGVGCRQVKVSMLNYLHNLSLMLEPRDIVNSSDVRLAVSRIVTWTTEPKSIEVRKVFHVHLARVPNVAVGDFNRLAVLESGLMSIFAGLALEPETA